MIPTATSNIGYVEILTEQKLCRKGLHWYPVADKACKECRKKTQHNWYLANREQALKESKIRYRANREHVLERVKRWGQANRERMRECSKKWREDNAERNRERSRKWREDNPERNREYAKKWDQDNQDTRNAIKARRRAAQKNALAPWANASAIKNFYTEASRLTKLTGVKHHVDHIYPLQSEYMCGLHVEANLQILTEKENILKGNRTWPGQLECQKGSVYARFPKELTDLLNDQQT